MSRDIQAELASVRQRADDARVNGLPGNRVYRATPGCTDRCPRCDVGCAVLQGLAYDLEREIRGMPPILQWGGFTYPEIAGRA